MNALRNSKMAKAGKGIDMNEKRREEKQKKGLLLAIEESLQKKREKTPGKGF